MWISGCRKSSILALALWCASSSALYEMYLAGRSISLTSQRMLFSITLAAVPGHLNTFIGKTAPSAQHASHVADCGNAHTAVRQCLGIKQVSQLTQPL